MLYEVITDRVPVDFYPELRTNITRPEVLKVWATSSSGTPAAVSGRPGGSARRRSARARTRPAASATRSRGRLV